jgi:outer membrane protein assembly factor BamB
MRAMVRPLLFVLICTATTTRADDWPVFRGPNRDGISAEKDWTYQWPGNEPKQLFKVNVKPGFSCPIIKGDRLWTMGHAKGKDVVSCLDAGTGKPIWKYEYDALPIGTVKPDYEGTRSTPTLDDGRLYTLSRDGKIFCFDAASGAIHWQADATKDPGAGIPTWGFAGSPIVHDDIVLFNIGGGGLAFDKSSGAIKWKSANTVAGYATPTLYQANGKSRTALFGPDRITGVETETGKELWTVPWKTQYKINSAELIFHDGKLFASSAYNYGCAVIDVSTDQPKIIWQNHELKNHCNSTILYQGCLYGFDGNNIVGQGLKCLDFATGQVKWTAEKPSWGNLILAGDKFIILSQSGDLIIAKASPEKYEELAQCHPLGGTFWTAPVLANGILYLRNTQGDFVGLDMRKPN